MSFYDGYQAAMRDIARELDLGGPDAVRRWLLDNNRDDNSGHMISARARDAFEQLNKIADEKGNR